MIKRAFNSAPIPVGLDIAVLILRVGISVMMLTHGFPKFLKLMSGDMSFADPLGMGENTSLILTVVAEFLGSICLILGLFTRPFAVLLIITMVVAAFIIHASDGFAKQEHALLFLFPYISIFITGPGKFSLDHRLVNKFLR